MSTCEWCDTEFTPHKNTPLGRQRFCSRRCQTQALWYESQATASETHSTPE